MRSTKRGAATTTTATPKKRRLFLKRISTPTLWLRLRRSRSIGVAGVVVYALFHFEYLYREYGRFAVAVIDVVIEQLLERLAIQSKKKVKNYPFLMGQGVWLGSDKLGPEDTVGEVLRNFRFLVPRLVILQIKRRVYKREIGLGPEDTVGEVLKHGTLTVGFIGLAECLKALVGKHHGEGWDAQNLGLEIVKHMRDRTPMAPNGNAR